MFTKLHRWWIEVDQDRKEPSLGAQARFIRDFGSELYFAVDHVDGPLHHLRYVYFTRLFMPERDEMGAYVRLHFFVDEQNQGAAIAELNRRLQVLQAEGAVFQIRKDDPPINGVDEAGRKGAASCPDLYYSYMECLSRTAVQLFQRDVTVTDTMVWEWTHNFFNLLRGYKVSIIEFPPGILVRSWQI